MFRFLFFLSLFFVGCSNYNNTRNGYENTSKSEIYNEVNLPTAVDTPKPKIDLAFLVGKTFLSGTVHQLKFINSKKLSITFERYYDGSWGKHTIVGEYELLNESDLKVHWSESNTISWLNTWGECEMQTVKQSESFSDLLTLNINNRCITISSVFQQSFYAGNRCGNEDKTTNGSYEFCLN